jgi:acetyl-CoA carboxylase/biotin carboxylase 1
VAQDRLFELASQRARARGVPRLYIAANSGARIGLAREVMDAFGVQWTDPAEPLKGFEYDEPPTLCVGVR